MGNSKVSMNTSLIMNLVNIVGNAILIYGFHMEIAGAAIPTLISVSYTHLDVYKRQDIDRATDVLSFPMLEFDEDGISDDEYDMDGELVMLGDIVISMERCV